MIGARRESSGRKGRSSIMHTSSRWNGFSCVLAALAALPGSASVSGQGLDVAAVMRCHERDVLPSQLEPSERSPLDCATPVHHLTPGASPEATVGAVLDGLVDVALTSTHSACRWAPWV